MSRSKDSRNLLSSTISLGSGGVLRLGLKCGRDFQVNRNSSNNILFLKNSKAAKTQSVPISKIKNYAKNRLSSSQISQYQSRKSQVNLNKQSEEDNDEEDFNMNDPF